MLSPWAAVRVCSRRGAAHQRRGQPCQDASLLRRFSTGRGESLLLLAVADGHGASRHHRSAVGSALACEAAAATLAEGLAAGLAAEPEGLRHWLAEGWPAAVQRHWRAATEEHWRADAADAAAAAMPYSPIPYGTTLGLLLLGPGWWAHAGLGDWDLVGIGPAGETQLLSEEPALYGSGEATASLCQETGVLVGWRWDLQPQLAAAPFALALCTDGVRKSCAGDGDFLALAGWLAELAGRPTAPGGEQELAAALDRISREGCGDDVSVALALWGAAPPPAAVGAGATGEGVQAGDAAEGGAGFQGGEAVAAGDAAEGAETAWPAEAASAGALPDRQAAAGWTQPRSTRVRLGIALAALALGIAAAARWAVEQRVQEQRAAELRVRQQQARAPSDSWRREVERLCGSPDLVAPSLASRRSQVEALRRGALRPEVLLAQAERDPLGALIAAGFPALPPEPLRQSGFARLPLCPALRHGLAQLWMSSSSTSPSPASPATPVSPIAPGLRHD